MIENNNLKLILCDFKKIICDQFEEINKTYQYFGSHIDYKEIFEFIINKNSKSKSYDVILSEFLFNDKLNCSKTTIINCRNNINDEFMEILNNRCLTFFYQMIYNDYRDNNKTDFRRLLAVDGTYLALNKNEQTLFLTLS